MRTFKTKPTGRPPIVCATEGERLERQKKAARARVWYALQTGELVRPQKCEECLKDVGTLSDGRSEMHAHHHKGYDHPLEIQWLCPFCHGKLDAPTRARGIFNGGTLHSDEVVAEVLSRWAAGESYRDLSLEFRVAISTMYKWRSGVWRK